LHGYSGTWDFELNLQTWRDVSVVHPGYVTVQGYLNLIMPANGQSGRGFAHGRLYYKLPIGESEVYQGEYHTAHEIRNAICLKDGSLTLTTEAFAIQKVTATGTPPVQLADIECSPEPWTAKWTLTPLSARALGGDVCSEGVMVMSGQAQLTKSSDIL
jgi:hypothetical protein